MQQEDALKSHCLPSEHNVEPNKQTAPMPKDNVNRAIQIDVKHEKKRVRAALVWAEATRAGPGRVKLLKTEKKRVP